MKHRRLVVLMTLLLAVTAPAAEIKLPSEIRIKPGRLSKIDAVTDSKFPVRWINLSPDVDLIPSESGKWAIVTSPTPGSYRLAAIASDEKGASEPAYTTLVVDGGPGPGPGPGPIPPSPPRPLPDGPLGLIKASRIGAQTVTSDNRIAEARALAEAQRTHAAGVAAGRFATTAAILDGWRAANRGALKEDATKFAAWKAWGDIVKARVTELDKGGKLVGNAAWSDAFLEIATGLDPTFWSRER